MINLGKLYIKMQDQEKALAYFKSCQELINKSGNSDNPVIADCIKEIGLLHLHMGQSKEAKIHID